MAAYDFTTYLPVYDAGPPITNGWEGYSDNPRVDPLRDAIDKATSGAVQLNPIQQVATSYADVEAGTVKFAWGFPFQPGVPGSALIYLGMPFGLESPEVMSWWYEGGGSALYAGLLATAGKDVVMFPSPHWGEAHGWYKEAITLKKLLEGKYATGEDIKFRLFGDGQAVHNLAFPNVQTPAATPGASFLTDIFSGVFTGGEFADARGEASPINGLFPNWPSKTGSIVEALGGSPHFYSGSWHTPARIMCLWVNKTWYDAQPATVQAQIEIGARAAAMTQMGRAIEGQDAFLTTMQDLGVVVHKALPTDVLDRLRDATGDALDAAAAADGTGAYQAILDSLRDFAIKNQFRQYSFPERRYRFQVRQMQGATPESDHFEPDVQF